MTLKRQRVEEKLQGVPSKRPRKQAKIKELEKQIITSPTNYNQIVDLLEMCIEDHPETIHFGISALSRVFCHLWKDGRMDGDKDNEDNLIAHWLKEKYIQLVKFLYEMFAHPEPALQVTALRLYFKLLKAQISRLENSVDGVLFPNSSFINAVKAILQSKHFSDALSAEFCSKYLNVHDDIRYFFLKDAAKTINHLPAADLSKQNTVRDNLLNLLLALNTMPTEEKELDTFWSSLVESKKSEKHIIQTLSAHKKVFQECWLALLRLPMTNDQYKSLLLIVHRRIAPYMIKPQLLMDFLTESYDAGGVTSLLALNGLFQLMQKYNLDYPNFYVKLYALFDRNLMHVRYRSRFFRLLELFLSSTHLPASIIASFLKRMSQLALAAPPGAIISIIPLTYNLLKKHPSCMSMIHRTNNPQCTDLFDCSENDPAKTGALDSSLWEMASLQNHFNPNVATLAKILSEQFTKPSYNMEDFLDHSYSTMFEAEITRKIKKPPAIEFQPLEYIFALADENQAAAWFS
ncbi:hypothetical protein NEOLI_001960 [Neolecta irregularis DAH-3]|uniref:CCAAT-binding factor domain-containing protein n=1 Tax=Neolecta irregularis (strain DAH-3) TaxID=1198029 RepID=A0A1U7LLN5_NEOID|nr:hypothetical protein NEOLI_001960 [Neolecta irregularis DAH-3]|eukprot:OLL23452.1 hypothetical protein NEOLI_001960 [Neolecta irregularis DAH-3]